MTMRILDLAPAGNTDYLALITLQAKGYELTENLTAPLELIAEAEKERRRFRGSSWLEVLGLVTLWEMRGDDWQLRDDEPQPDETLDQLRQITE
jgi:hypothetical protein